MSAKKKVAKSSKKRTAEVETTTTRATRKKAKRKEKKPLGSCFVLMPFKEPFDAYYESIIKPAVIAANLDPLRGDSLFTPTPIMGDAWRMIQEAKVLVAEFTGKNPNVFYELGLGHAIGKPIVLISETMDDVPFDLQQLRVILYDKNDPAWGNELKTNIAAALGETLSNPVNAVPPMFRKAVKSQAPAESELKIRVDMLEQEMRSLARSAVRLGAVPRPISVEELKRKILSKPYSEDEIKMLIAEALVSGLDSKAVEEELGEMGFSSRHARRIMKSAISLL